MCKRIVIICRFSEDQDRGILKTLGPAHRSSPFVRTHLYDYKDRRYSSKITRGTPYLYLRPDSISTKPIKDWQVLLVTDTLEFETKYYPEDIFDSGTFVMYHSTPANTSEYLDRKTISLKKQGEHEPGEENGYPLINNLVASYEEATQSFKETEFNAAVDKLIEWFGINDVLEAKLNLLHDCLHPDKIPASVDRLLAAESGAAFYKFKNEVVGKKWCNKEYIDALTELRRSLLGP